MHAGKNTIERAFELAKTGSYGSISELKSALNAEGFSSDQLTGPTLLRQIRDLLRLNLKSA